LWTKEDLTYSLKKKHEDIMVNGCKIFSQSLNLSKDKRPPYITKEMQKLFPKMNEKENQIFQENTSRIFKENEFETMAKSINEFLKKQIHWYMNKYERKM